MIQNERQQSAVKMPSRMLFRLAVRGARYSLGMLLKASCSCTEMKFEKKTPGMRANSKAMPAVKAKLI